MLAACHMMLGGFRTRVKLLRMQKQLLMLLLTFAERWRDRQRIRLIIIDVVIDRCRALLLLYLRCMR